MPKQWTDFFQPDVQVSKIRKGIAHPKFTDVNVKWRDVETCQPKVYS